ncbi:MAG TPA: hypothetical protein VKV17_16700 [Bryobacteraceae bacterium]|nr:hypothetical protein [Bryobacteraceae bacterium]
MHLPKLLAVALVCAAALPAQPASYSSVFISVGAAYGPQSALTPTVDVGVEIGSSHFYSISTLMLGRPTATLRTGFGYTVKRSGPVAVMALLDGGLSSLPAGTSGILLGNIGGGAGVRYDLGYHWKSLAGLNVVASLRETAISGASVTPEYSFKLSYFLK